jgi:hypothetical protein
LTDHRSLIANADRIRNTRLTVPLSAEEAGSEGSGDAMKTAE